MTSGSLTDLDPPPAPERRWPFYVAWAMGGLVVGAVLVSRLPASVVPAPAPVAAPVTTSAPVQPEAPARFRSVNPLPQPGPLRGAPVPVAPARP
jgi:hypothetical protein